MNLPKFGENKFCNNTKKIFFYISLHSTFLNLAIQQNTIPFLVCAYMMVLKHIMALRSRDPGLQVSQSSMCSL